MSKLWSSHTIGALLDDLTRGKAGARQRLWKGLYWIESARNEQRSNDLLGRPLGASAPPHLLLPQFLLVLVLTVVFLLGRLRLRTRSGRSSLELEAAALVRRRGRSAADEGDERGVKCLDQEVLSCTGRRFLPTGLGALLEDDAVVNVGGLSGDDRPPLGVGVGLGGEGHEQTREQLSGGLGRCRMALLNEKAYSSRSFCLMVKGSSTRWMSCSMVTSPDSRRGSSSLSGAGLALSASSSTSGGRWPSTARLQMSAISPGVALTKVLRLARTKSPSLSGSATT